MDGEWLQKLCQSSQVLAMNEVVACNAFTDRYGLTLTPEQATELVSTRALSLQQTGRVEFGGGIISAIIREFCDSPYLNRQNYAEIVHNLIDLFYTFKNETMDILSDEELLRFMHQAFDGCCQGSLELLAGRELERLAKTVRAGMDCEPVYDEEENENADGD